MADIYGKCKHCEHDLDAGLILDEFKRQRAGGVSCFQGKTDAELQAGINSSYGVTEPQRFSHAVWSGKIFVCPEC